MTASISGERVLVQYSTAQQQTARARRASAPSAARVIYRTRKVSTAGAAVQAGVRETHGSAREDETAVCHASLRRRPNPKQLQLRLLASLLLFSSIHCPLPHQLSSVSGSVEKPLPRTSRFKVCQGVANREQHRIAQGGIAGLDWLRLVFCPGSRSRVPMLPRAEQQSEGDGIEKVRKGSIDTTGCT